MISNQTENAGTTAAEKTGTTGGKNGKTSSAGASPHREGAESREAMELFTGKRQSADELAQQLKGFLGVEEEKAEVRGSPKVKVNGEAPENAADLNAGIDGPEPEGEPQEGEGEGHEEQEGQPEQEGEGEGDREAEAEPGNNGKWPKSAVEAIAEKRKTVRELKGQLETLKDQHATELADLRGQLEAGEFKRPLAPTEENPLGFVTDGKGLNEFVRDTKRTVRLIEDFLDDGLDSAGESALKKWASSTGNLDADGQLDKAGLKRYKRLAEDALTEYVPQRAEQLQKEGQFSAHAEKTFDFWGKRNAPEYQDAMGVVKALPSIRNLPHWKVAASVFALGMREYRKMQETAGKNGNGANENGNGKARQEPRTTTVNTPGRAVTLPRTGSQGGAKNEMAALSQKIREKKATGADFERYTRLQLAGALGG